MAEHADMPPSTIPRIVRCVGSWQASRGIEQEVKSFTREGTAAHILGARCAAGNLDPAQFKGEIITVEGEDFVVDDEMIAAVDLYRSYVRALPVDEHFIEERVESAILGTWGTTDHRGIAIAERVQYVTDLKYGKGVKVHAQGNEQLYAYAVAGYERDSLIHDIDFVEVAIVQPRLDHISAHRLPVQELLEWARQTASILELARSGTDLPLTPGAKQCKFCPAKGSCPALRDFVGSTVSSSFDSLIDGRRKASELAPSEWIGATLPHLDLIRDWCNAVEGEANRRLSAGIEVPGWKLVEGRRGQRQWADETEVEKTLKSFRLKKEEMYDLKLISPATAEKRLKESPRRWAKVEALISRAPPKPTIAPLSDKRPAITVKQQSAFPDLSAEQAETDLV